MRISEKQKSGRLQAVGEGIERVVNICEPPGINAFTLIELLVVITIIVVLLAMLTPALDRVMYEAKLMECGTRQKTAAQGAHIYTYDNKRRYPSRDGVSDPERSPILLYNSTHISTPITPGRAHTSNYDDRQRMLGYIPMGTLVDPLAGDADLSPDATDDDSHVNSSYPLWFGWHFLADPQASGLFKMSDRLTTRGDKLNIIITDKLTKINATTGGGRKSHPDRNLKWRLENFQNTYNNELNPTSGKVTMAQWRSWGADFTEFDYNAAFLDGSVRRYRDVPALGATVPYSDRGYYGLAPVPHWVTTPPSNVALLDMVPYD